MSGAQHTPGPDGTPIDCLDLSARAYNALRAAGITTVGQLRQSTGAQLRRLPGMGAVSVADVKEQAAKRGVELGSALPPSLLQAARKLLPMISHLQGMDGCDGLTEAIEDLRTAVQHQNLRTARIHPMDACRHGNRKSDCDHCKETL